MIEITFDRSSHHGFISPPPNLSIAALAEIRKIGHEQNTYRVREIEHEWVIDLDVDAQQIESGPFRICNVILNRLDIPSCINPFRMMRLIKRATEIDRVAI